MKLLTSVLFVVALLSGGTVFTQETINFQGVLRDLDGEILVNEEVDLRFRIFQANLAPTQFELEEEHRQVATNQFGVVSIPIGMQESLDQLDFASQQFEIEIALRMSGDTQYEIMATDRLGATPYAMHALTVENADDADADPSNEMQTLSFDSNSGKLQISSGNEVTLPMGSSDSDSDPENELQKLTMLGNGHLNLSKGGGSVPIVQSPLVSTRDEDGDFAYRLNQKLGIGNGDIDGGAMLDINGPAKASLYFLNDRIKLLPAGSGFRSFRIENDQETLAEFDASSGNERATLKIDQVRIGDVKISNRFVNNENEIYMHIDGTSDQQLLRLGPEISAINSERLFLTNLSLLHGPSSNGDVGLNIFNSGGNGNNWNMYVANGNGNLEFYHRGSIKARVRSSDGAWVVNSDKRYKTEIASLGSVLPLILKLEPKSYRYKNDPKELTSLGFIAQDVLKLYPHLVEYDSDRSDFMGLNYQGFSVLAIKAVQELSEKLEDEEEKNRQLENRLEILEQKINQFDTRSTKEN